MIRAAALAIALSCSTAQASAIYEWHSPGGSTAGRFEISDAAHAAGRLAGEFDGRGMFGGNPDSALMTFSFASLRADLRDRAGFNEQFVLDLSFSDGVASGSIRARTDNDLLTMASSGASWVVDRYATDAPGACQPNGLDRSGCSGLTGRWVLAGGAVMATQTFQAGQVGLPGTLGLLVVGVLGLVAALRRRKASLSAAGSPTWG